MRGRGCCGMIVFRYGRLIFCATGPSALLRMLLAMTRGRLRIANGVRQHAAVWSAGDEARSTVVRLQRHTGVTYAMTDGHSRVLR